MAMRKKIVPEYGTVVMKETEYYRTRVKDLQGRRISLYAKTKEELYEKEKKTEQNVRLAMELIGETRQQWRNIARSGS